MIQPIGSRPPPRRPVDDGTSENGSDLSDIADALAEIDELNDPAGLRVLFTALPRALVLTIPHNPRPRFQLIHLVRGCADFSGGGRALFDAVHTVLPEGCRGRSHALRLIARHWSLHGPPEAVRPSDPAPVD
ncbi:hypothetical protein Val02_65250 [Virgisporangium aliadipatigenens]|uniref:Effector-associated domain-containing protein n=1 Tax=Virgisporangium aliadipatigenens TaxID=741659 RepID=A0A8J3YPY1_9ACTN|nr:hypothetical protein [Virgisporangium aliadipatigenens]GIJ49639.1 hypothetical protein Val02_65250 [Virgisporangium aliadipatigenens]